MIRCRIAREVSPGVVQYLPFLGPSVDHIPRGWSIVCSRVTTKRG